MEEGGGEAEERVMQLTSIHNQITANSLLQRAAQLAK